MKQDGKVISVYSTTERESKAGYAMNLAVSLVMITKDNILFVDTVPPFRYAENNYIGIKSLRLERINRQRLERFKNDYRYTIVNLPFEQDELMYEAFGHSDAVHFFVDSTKDDLAAAHGFLEDLVEKGLMDIHSKLKVVVNRLNIFDKFSTEEITWLLKKEVWAVLPEPGILDTPVDPKGTPLVLRSKDSTYSKAVLQIAKRESGKLLGLALGSGAAFGLAHIGILKVLENAHISADIVSGSSIGALIASMYGLGLSAVKIEYIARKLKNRLSIMRLVDFTFPISAILAGRRLKRFLKSILGEKTFEDLKIPVKIMIYDLANRETLVVEKGSLVDAVYMSISVPGIFKPKIQKERMIIDGGVSDPVPVDILLKQDVKKIIAVNVLPGPRDIHERNMLLKNRIKREENLMRTAPFYVKMGISIMNFFRRIFTPNIFDVIMTSMQSIEYELAENSCRKANVVLRPVLPTASSVDFHLVKDLIKRGEEEALSHIEEIKRLADI